MPEENRGRVYAIIHGTWHAGRQVSDRGHVMTECGETVRVGMPGVLLSGTDPGRRMYDDTCPTCDRAVPPVK